VITIVRSLLSTHRVFGFTAVILSELTPLALEAIHLSKEDHIERQGTVETAKGGGIYSILLEDGNTVLAKLSGKLQRFKIRVIAGDKVTVAVSPYDPTHGFITQRAKF
jgi:translation initiation factor IF-1